MEEKKDQEEKIEYIDLTESAPEESNSKGDWFKCIKKPDEFQGIEIDEHFKVNTANGKFSGEPGDYLLIAENGEKSIVKKEDFNDNNFLKTEEEETETDTEPTKNAAEIDTAADEALKPDSEEKEN